MTDLAYEEVALLARVAGLSLAADDLADVTHRLNMLRARLEQFDYPGLAAFDPVPFFPLEEDANDR